MKYDLFLCGYSREVIQNSTISDSLLKNKMLLLPIKGQERHPQRRFFTQSISQDKTTLPILRQSQLTGFQFDDSMGD